MTCGDCATTRSQARKRGGTLTLRQPCDFVASRKNIEEIKTADFSSTFRAGCCVGNAPVPIYTASVSCKYKDETIHSHLIGERVPDSRACSKRAGYGMRMAFRTCLRNGVNRLNAHSTASYSRSFSHNELMNRLTTSSVGPNVHQMIFRTSQSAISFMEKMIGLLEV